MKKLNKGLLLVLSGPSGSGKGSITKRLLDEPNIHLSISATTRTPRAGEKDGIDYFFISKKDFQERIDNKDMLEYNEYCENFYGTPRKETLSCLEQGKDVILEIDVNGARQVQNCQRVVSIFILPPSIETLEERLKNRGTETEDVIRKRMSQAREEIRQAFFYDYVIVNNTLEKAVQDVKDILNAEKHTVEYMKSKLKEVLEDE